MDLAGLDARALLDLLGDDGNEVGPDDVEDEAESREGEHRDRNDRENEEVRDRGPELVAQTRDEALDGADEMRRAVREQVRGGADLIKIMACHDTLETTEVLLNPRSSFSVAQSTVAGRYMSQAC